MTDRKVSATKIEPLDPADHKHTVGRFRQSREIKSVYWNPQSESVYWYPQSESVYWNPQTSLAAYTMTIASQKSQPPAIPQVILSGLTPVIQPVPTTIPSIPPHFRFQTDVLTQNMNSAMVSDVWNYTSKWTTQSLGFVVEFAGGPLDYAYKPGDKIEIWCRETRQVLLNYRIWKHDQGRYWFVESETDPICSRVCHSTHIRLKRIES